MDWNIFPCSDLQIGATRISVGYVPADVPQGFWGTSVCLAT